LVKIIHQLLNRWNIDNIIQFKIGYLYLHKGNWDGQQIVTAEWVADSVNGQIDATVKMPGLKWGYAWATLPYGEQDRHTLFGNGGFGGQGMLGRNRVHRLECAAKAVFAVLRECPGHIFFLLFRAAIRGGQADEIAIGIGRIAASDEDALLPDHW
jgi:hypothetical protein